MKPGEKFGQARLERWRYSTALGMLATCEIPRCAPEDAPTLRAELGRCSDLKTDKRAWDLVKSALECRRLGMDAEARRPCKLLQQYALEIEREVFGIEEAPAHRWGPFRIVRRLLRYRWN
jgi:hypothetical protein